MEIYGPLKTKHIYNYYIEQLNHFLKIQPNALKERYPITSYNFRN